MGVMRGSRIVATVATLAISVLGTVRAEGGLPRYQLEPGMELTYTGSGTFSYQGGNHVNEHETTAWVARRNEDGGVRVIVRQGSRFTATRDGEDEDAGEVPMEYDVGYFDLFPDGRIGPNAALGFRIAPESLFPRLPDDESEAKGEWTQQNDRLEKSHRYRSLQTEDGGWVFHADSVDPENEIYGVTSDTTYHLDAKRGLIQRIEQKSTQDYGFKGEGTGSSELTGVQTHDVAWLASFAPAAEQYFTVRKAYEEALKATFKAGDQAEKMLSEAKAVLEKARETIDHPVFRKQLDRQIAQHDDQVGYYVDYAKRRADVVDKPAADWKLQSLDGESHALADFRGKVVVLDFWYRGCGWCIKAMPQLNELAEQFKGRPVVVLGMNTDRNEDDAKMVAKTMGLKYATLVQAQKIPEKYGVRGFPTLIVIDPESMVREFHVGYSPTLRTELTRVIESLLPSE